MGAASEALAQRQAVEAQVVELLEMTPAPKLAVVDEVMDRAKVDRVTAEAALERLLETGRAEVFTAEGGGEEYRLVDGSRPE